MHKDIEELSINTLRMLSIDMVEKAQSGHPGLPLGAAPMAYTLFSRFMRHNPSDPEWRDRDRFILSAGHGCALLYSLLHLYGYGISIEDLENFRQPGSKTPGHPEYGITPGVEATTGPLGQGFAMGVGMAIAERTLADCFNGPEDKIIDHYTYGIVSDGDLMEGISSEAASFAGAMGLGKLIYLYDANHISIEGDTSITFTENVKQRFESYGWHTDKVEDGNSIEDITEAIERAKAQKTKPSLIIVRTLIGYGSPVQDTGKAHGEPLGEENLKKTKEFYGWSADSYFYVPEEVKNNFEKMAEKGRLLQEKWENDAVEYKKKYPENAELLEKYLIRNINPELGENILKFSPADKPIATRAASEKIMNNIEKYMTEFIGGSADLAPSTKTKLHGYGSIGVAGGCARNLHFGVREHAMGAIINGMALHGGLIPYSATFLTFSDYMRPAIRLGALMNIHSIYIFTHDSIGLGEDGPTHQPVEHLNSLRMIPNLVVMRPADANETSAAWNWAIVNKRPIVLAFSRQNLPVLDYEKYKIFEGVERGAYVMEGNPRECGIIIAATGSEVHLALGARGELGKRGVEACVVSMPSYEIFMQQDKNYRESVFPAGSKKFVIEAGATYFWRMLAGENGDVMGIDTFGESGPGEKIMEKFGFTVENTVERVMSVLNKKD
ncbi:MAG TPA: transketolase [Firmicutes bacterium]|nr:transketolase [Bacillota bacterium]